MGIVAKGNGMSAETSIANFLKQKIYPTNAVNKTHRREERPCQ